MLSVGGHFLAQVLDGLLGSAELLQTLLPLVVGGSQLLLQPSQALPQALALFLLCSQLQRRQSISGCCVAVLVLLPARVRSVPSLLLPVPAPCPLLQHRLCSRALFSLEGARPLLHLLQLWIELFLPILLIVRLPLQLSWRGSLLLALGRRWLIHGRRGDWGQADRGTPTAGLAHCLPAPSGLGAVPGSSAASLWHGPQRACVSAPARGSPAVSTATGSALPGAALPGPWGRGHSLSCGRPRWPPLMEQAGAEPWLGSGCARASQPQGLPTRSVPARLCCWLWASAVLAARPPPRRWPHVACPSPHVGMAAPLRSAGLAAALSAPGLLERVDAGWHCLPPGPVPGLLWEAEQGSALQCDFGTFAPKPMPLWLLPPRLGELPLHLPRTAQGNIICPVTWQLVVPQEHRELVVLTGLCCLPHCCSRMDRVLL